MVQQVVGLWRLSENCVEQNRQHDPFHQQKAAREASLQTHTLSVFVFYVVFLKLQCWESGAAHYLLPQHSACN